ncbi:hypothetical protein CHUAL_010821 [Chamberlinius hualienensis]
MPKKFQGENSKAVVAKARKEAVRKAENEKKQKEMEDALWAEDDKNVQKKLQRREEKEKKKQEQLDKKAQLKALEEAEMNSLKGAKPTTVKLTRAEIVAAKEQESLKTAEARQKDTLTKELPIEENVNRLLPLDGDQARTIDEAISILSVSEPDEDRHPEKRMKAAYAKFEETNLPRLKVENPNMRLSQLKQMLKKDWMKSSENPLNQRQIAYNNKT